MEGNKSFLVGLLKNISVLVGPSKTHFGFGGSFVLLVGPHIKRKRKKVAIIRCTKRQMSIKLNAALHLPAQAPRCPIKKCLVSLRGAQCTFRTKCTKRPTKSEKDPPKAQKTHQKHKRPTKTEMRF